MCGGTLLLLRKFCHRTMVLGIRAEPVRALMTVTLDREHVRLYLHAMPQSRGTGVSTRQAQRHRIGIITDGA